MSTHEVHYDGLVAEADSLELADRLARNVATRSPKIYRVTRDEVQSSLLPVGDIPGWQQVLAEDFASPVPVGGFVANQSGVLTPAGAAGYAAYGPGRTVGNEMRAYPDGWSTTHRNALYAPSKTLSVRGDVEGANGVLDIRHHTDAALNGSVIRPLGAAVWFPLAAYSGKFRIGPFARAEFRMRTADWNKGNPTFFHAVPLFIGDSWPNNGEFDFPEGDAAQDAPVSGWHHRASTNRGDQDRITTPAGTVMGDWHIYTVEWTPTEVRYFVDGRLCFASTAQVPQNPMAFVLQFETTSSAPAPDTAGRVQVDWVTLYRYAP